ncbi:hydroxymethylglutaryl-CoA synthase [Candidatus Woesebacteria bacterium]|nr:hydroxymethylglutaryl-CoA synthase [Candidatus Woesebacteria bacterium]
MIGIVDYGFYIPRFRITTETIAKQWGKSVDHITSSLKVREKAVARYDEDVLTMAYEASHMLFETSTNQQKKVGAVFIGSETFPYAVNPTSTTLAEWLDLGNNYLAYDTQFACKAATGALISAYGLVKSKEIANVLVCASDKANAKTNDALEFSAGSGANAWLIGSEHVLLEMVSWHSYASDTPDFWRRSKAANPSHLGRFTGEPAYFNHIMSSAKALLAKTHHQPNDFTHAVFHMPNGRFPLKVAKRLGFSQKQMKHSYVVPHVGNSYSASALMGLVGVLDVAKPGDLIFFVSYGSGAGSDAFVFKVTKEITKKRKSFCTALEHKTYIDYVTYLQFMHSI